MMRRNWPQHWPAFRIPRRGRPSSGAGFLVGGGYEFSRHLSVEGFFGYGAPDTGLDLIDQNIQSFGISFNA